MLKLKSKFKNFIIILLFISSFNAYAIQKEECENKFLEFHDTVISFSLFEMWHASSTAQNIIKECAILHKDEGTGFAYLMQSIVDFYGQDIPSFYKNIKKSAEMGYSPAQYYLSYFYYGYVQDDKQHMYWLDKAKQDRNFPLHLLQYSYFTNNDTVEAKAIQYLIERAKKTKRWLDVVNLSGAIYIVSEDKFKNVNLEELKQLNREAQERLFWYRSEGQDVDYYIQFLITFEERIELLEKLAEDNKNTSAMMRLYTIYNDKGYNFYKPLEAKKRLKQAIYYGNESALYVYLSTNFLDKFDDLSEVSYGDIELIKTSYNNGIIFHAYILGAIYERSEDVIGTKQKAIDWYEKAAQYDQIDSLLALVRIYEEQGNEEKLKFYLEKLSNHPHPEHSQMAKEKLLEISKSVMR